VNRIARADREPARDQTSSFDDFNVLHRRDELEHRATALAVSEAMPFRCCGLHRELAFVRSAMDRTWPVQLLPLRSQLDAVVREHHRQRHEAFELLEVDALRVLRVHIALLLSTITLISVL
jgi:hypothetical protein